eukprot:gene9652-27393_t
MQPTRVPTQAPVTGQPTKAPKGGTVTMQPTRVPTQAPVTGQPTKAPKGRTVTMQPTRVPTQAPVTGQPTQAPAATEQPTAARAQRLALAVGARCGQAELRLGARVAGSPYIGCIVANAAVGAAGGRAVGPGDAAWLTHYPSYPLFAAVLLSAGLVVAATHVVVAPRSDAWARAVGAAALAAAAAVYGAGRTAATRAGDMAARPAVLRQMRETAATAVLSALVAVQHSAAARAGGCAAFAFARSAGAVHSTFIRPRDA